VIRVITAASPCRQQGGPRRHSGRRRLALIIAPPSLAAAAAQVAIVGKFAAAAITRSRSISASEKFSWSCYLFLNIFFSTLKDDNKPTRFLGTVQRKTL
jgi:hypothetical protein